jgi:hypothetical protein
VINAAAKYLYAITSVLLALANAAANADPEPVDLALLLAVDCSGSVDGREFRLQLDGIAKAFNDRDVIAAIKAGPYRRIAVNMMLWADPDEQKLTTGWRVITGEQQAHDFAEEVRAFDIRIGGGTGLGIALGYGANVLQNAPFTATRKVMDVSGDGRESWEIREPRFRLPQAQILLGKTNIVVNGLAIAQDVPDLAQYYAEEVTHGPGSFVITASTYEDFADAMRIKLLREILPDVAALRR